MPQIVEKKLGVEFISAEEFPKACVQQRTFTTEPPYRLADIEHQIRMFPSCDKWAENIFDMYADLTKEDWLTMLNASIVYAQKERNA